MTPRTVLVVDDDEDIRTLVELALRRSPGWRVLLAGSGDAALELARRERPDLILLDVTMPGMDGPTTLEVLRSSSETREVPVVLTTARSQRHELARLAELGCAILQKPFDPLELPAELQRIAERSNAR